MTPLDLSWYDLGALIVGPLVFMVGIGITIYLVRQCATTTNHWGEYDREEMWVTLIVGPIFSILGGGIAALVWPVLVAAIVLSIIPIKVMNFHISELFEKEKVNHE